MALTNYSLPSFPGLAQQAWAATISPTQAHHVNNLLYGPAGHQESDEPPVGVSHQDYYKNSPYHPPAGYQFRPKANYLPPQPPAAATTVQHRQHHRQQPPQQQQQIDEQSGSGLASYNHQQLPPQPPPRTSYLPPTQSTRTYGESNYGSHIPTRNPPSDPGQQQFYDGYSTPNRGYNTQQQFGPTEAAPSLGVNSNNIPGSHDLTNPDVNGDGGFPQQLPGFTRVQAGSGSRTQVHAVLDYDADENDEADYYEGDASRAAGDGQKNPNVTPIQGPIFLKNGTAPVVPLFAYPTMNNGTFVQIPIWWTALSVALGLDIRGDVIKGVPCVKRYHQLFCPTAGNSYPIEKIERFIDDNKALMRRMYGDFEMIDTPEGKKAKRKRHTDEPVFGNFGDGMEFIPDDLEPGESYFANLRERNKRQSSSFRPNAGSSRLPKPLGRGASTGSSTSSSAGPGAAPSDSNTGRMDACESKIEIVTPYWASNSAGKIRAIVNTQHFEQAIHQEICTKSQTSRCGNDCGCEQKYKWHRLLAYDPDNDCKGIFMDWFLFPSCCVCRCAP